MENQEITNEVTVFDHEVFGQIRAVIINGEPFFVAKDISDILEYSETERMTRRLDEDEKTNLPFRGDGSNYQTNITVITESGLYNAITGSKKPEAKAFKKWVTSDVLPSIRKHGFYGTDDWVNSALSDPDNMIALLTKYKEERQKRLAAEQTIAVQKPKVEYFEALVHKIYLSILAILPNIYYSEFDYV